MKNTIRIYTDGGSRGNPGPSSCAFVVFLGEEQISKGSEYLGIGTNNQAEYQAVIIALLWIRGNLNIIKNNDINFYLDSELVVKQLTGLYRIKDLILQGKAQEINNLKAILNKNIQFNIVRREQNKLADKLVNETLDSHPYSKVG
jgi:ribonuclease HI